MYELISQFDLICGKRGTKQYGALTQIFGCLDRPIKSLHWLIISFSAMMSNQIQIFVSTNPKNFIFSKHLHSIFRFCQLLSCAKINLGPEVRELASSFCVTPWNRPRDYSFSTYAKFSEKRIFLTPWYVHTFVYQGVRNVSFSENFLYVLNEWSLIYRKKA